MICFNVGLAIAATFTSTKDYVNYYGDHLDTWLRIFGTIANQFDRGATTLDELVSNDLIISFILPFSGQKIDLCKLGALLGDLSPRRFDELCTALEFEYFEVDELVKGYPPKQESAWKSASLESASKSVMPSCISRKQIIDCLDYWLGMGNDEMIRQLLHEDLWFRAKCSRHEEAFRGHEAEYIGLLCQGIRKGYCVIIFLPEFIKVEHLSPIVELSNTRSWPYRLKLHSDSSDRSVLSMVKSINGVIDQRDVGIDETYYDSDDFMGEWPLPLCATKWVKRVHPAIHSLIHELPLSLRQAFNAYLKYGNLNILRNTLAFMSELVLEHRETIQAEYYGWLGGARPYTPRIKDIALLIRPFLVSMPQGDQPLWHLLPLFREIDANPQAFWPPNLLLDGIQFVKEQIQKMSLTEDEILEAIKEQKMVPDAHLYCLAWHQKWNRLRMATMTHEAKVRFPKTTTRIAFELSQHVPEMTFGIMMATIAFSANMHLLSTILNSYSPVEILAKIEVPHIRNRIALMMHLVHKVASYLDGRVVNKNSIFFRDWVMLHLTAANGQRVADLKLLYYYFYNRIFGNYEGFDLFNLAETGNYMMFGLLNEPGTDVRRSVNRCWHLTFE